ncbi:menaquinone-dependent protoporphyrinogen IX dehydrogenase [Jeongeupia chitinilytica]|nr:menaquinone-dependent protoporphyrinogen IX dehydrogenase [Jeongeupia chitinilytica]
METLLICYASRDGQAAKIAERVAAGCTGGVVLRCDLRRHQPDAAELANASAIVVIAAVRYGRHLPEAEHLLQREAAMLQRKPLALVSVNLSARKPGKDNAGGNVYLGKWLARHRLQPALAAAFAGRLDYPRYRWFDRLMIRMIMAMSGGPTDPATVVEYTDWTAVDRFATLVGRLGAQRPRM